jgi:flagellar biosynthetic protein FlhB
MADERDDTERTEDPTPKRLEEAIRRGDVVKSAEVNTWFMIAGGTFMLMVFAPPMAATLEATFRGLLAHSWQIRTDGPALVALARNVAMAVLAALGIPLLLLCLAALAGSVIQHRFLFSVETILPRAARISPAAGLERLFSRQALANFAKGLVKLAVIGAVMISLLWPQRYRLIGLIGKDPAAIMPFTLTLATQMLGTVVAILAIVAAADYLFQYRQWFERQKMSVREMKEEFRQTEGDPAIKGKLRQLRQARAQADDGGSAEGLGRHHQPDAFCRRPAIRARHECAGLRRQGRRSHRPQDPRGGARARHSRGREPAARPRPARHRGDRPGNSARALPRRR